MLYSPARLLCLATLIKFDLKMLIDEKKYDAAYFEELLETSRAACLQYELANKDEMIQTLSGPSEAYASVDEARKKKKQLKKQGASKEEITAADQEIKKLKQAA